MNHLEHCPMSKSTLNIFSILLITFAFGPTFLRATHLNIEEQEKDHHSHAWVTTYEQISWDPIWLRTYFCLGLGASGPVLDAVFFNSFQAPPTKEIAQRFYRILDRKHPYYHNYKLSNELNYSMVSLARAMLALNFNHNVILSHNKLTVLPKSLGVLTNITLLDLSFNQLEEIPSFLRNLPNLQKLYLAENPAVNTKKKINEVRTKFKKSTKIFVGKKYSKYKNGTRGTQE